MTWKPEKKKNAFYGESCFLNTSNEALWEELWAIIGENLLVDISRIAFFSCFIFDVIV